MSKNQSKRAVSPSDPDPSASAEEAAQDAKDASGSGDAATNEAPAAPDAEATQEPEADDDAPEGDAGASHEDAEDDDQEDEPSAPDPALARCPKCTDKHACSLKCYRAAGYPADRFAEHLNGKPKPGHLWAKVHSHGVLSHDLVDHKANSWIQLPRITALELSETNVISLTGEF